MKETTRREFIKKSAILTASGVVLSAIGDVSGYSLTTSENQPEPFSLPPLNYPYNALEPHIDAMTMEIHHSKHHQAYVNNLNKAIKDGNLQTGTLEELIANVSKFPVSVRNNGGGHWNHSFFWKIMKPGGGGEPTGKAGEAIRQAFGSTDELKKQINEAGLKRFGSGWTWLILDKDGKLVVCSTPNQDNPLMDIADVKGKPILGIDVWEHAYYLKYQNKRADYLNAWWNVIDWDHIAQNL